MYKVIIAEDEVASARYMKNIIEKCCEGFVVTDSAADGKSALEIIKQQQFDVLITDIHMPIMNGIELVTQVHALYPYMVKVIVSGFSEFEYAQKAIKAEVADYLLKPINIEHIKTLMSSIKEKLDKAFIQTRINLLQKAVAGENPLSDAELNLIFPNRFHGALLRIGGLRLSYYIEEELKKSSFENEEISRFFYMNHNCWVIPRKDRNDFVILNSSEENIQTVITLLTEMFFPEDYYTAVFYNKLFKIIEIRDVYKALGKIMKCNVVTGNNQLLYYATAKATEGVIASEQKRLASIIQQYSLNGKYSIIKEILHENIIKWKVEMRPQKWVYDNLREIFYKLEEEMIVVNPALINVERELSSVIYSAKSMAQIYENTWALFEMVLSQSQDNLMRQDTESFFDAIIDYIDSNFDKPLTLQNVCDSFAISQTYLSRLFRKYKDTSFNNYLTEIRIDRAVELISAHPDMPLKNISDMVGYNDSAYFSKVFRNLMGKSPSRFQKSD